MEQLILPDGTAIGSGELGKTAICRVRRTQDRNQGSELTLGSACVGLLEVELFCYQKPPIPPGTRLEYREGEETLGIYYCQDLRRLGKNRWRLTAQDAMTRFCRELETPLEGTVAAVLDALCRLCGVENRVEDLPGGDLPVPPVTGLTGHGLLGFLGQAAGRYFYVDAQECLRSGWYDKICTIDNYYHLTTAEYATAPIQRVLLRQNKNDVGSVYPEGEGNTLILEGNPIFLGDSRHIAQRLQSQLDGFTHTPFTCRLLPGQWVPPGCLVEFPDLDGVERLGAVMGWEMENGVCTIRGVGSPTLQSPQAFHRLTLQDLEGQMLSVSRTAQGLEVSHSDLRGNVAEVTLSLKGIGSRVTAVESTAQGIATQTSHLSQTADGLSLRVTQLTGTMDGKTDREEFSQVTEHFLFDGAGMTIQNSASGMGIRVSENQVCFLGGDDPTTLVRPDNMETTRLTVGERLDLGDFSFLPRTGGNLSFRYTGKDNS